MSWSWKIATIAGIPIYLHGTFIALIAFVLLSDWSHGHDLAAALAGAFFVIVIFATVILHELGHALVARRYGIRTQDITLLPIGGIARLERMPDVPRQELWVALAGPAVNIALAGAAFLIQMITTAQPVNLLDVFSDGLIGRFAGTNLWLAAFNLIPAFPMDGGRALRALLAEGMDYVRATRLAATLGQGLAFVFGFVGLFSNPFLVFIALFVWMGASSEATAVELRNTLTGVPVTHAMMTDFKTLDAADPLRRAADLTLAGSQRDFPVLVNGRMVGVLTRDALVAALAERGPGTPVGDVMTREFVSADSRELLEPALHRLQTCHCQLLAVLRGHDLVGIVSADNVGEYVMLRGAAAKRVAAGLIGD